MLDNLCIITSAIVALAAIFTWTRHAGKRKNRVENSYFNYHKRLPKSNNNTVNFLITSIENIFFVESRNGQIRPNMKIMNLYKIVSNGVVDDLELERLCMEIEGRYKLKLNEKLDLSDFTIQDLADYIEKQVA